MARQSVRNATGPFKTDSDPAGIFPRHDAHRHRRSPARGAGRPRDAAARRAGPRSRRNGNRGARRSRPRRAPQTGRGAFEHRLPDGDGLALIRRLRALENPPQVILYTAEPDPSLGLLARVAGAAGLVDKQAEPAELFEAVRVVARGGSRSPRTSPPRSSTPPPTSWTRTTSRCWRCSSTARLPGRSPTRCGWTAGACSGAPSACSGSSAPAHARASPPRRARGARSRVPAPRPRAGRTPFKNREPSRHDGSARSPQPKRIVRRMRIASVTLPPSTSDEPLKRYCSR